MEFNEAKEQGLRRVMGTFARMTQDPRIVRGLSALMVGFVLSLSTVVEAGKKPAPPSFPSVAEQQAFSDRYWNAMNEGPEAVKKLSDEVTGKPGEQGDMESRMLQNLQHGKAADGGEARGFRGDPSDPGPSDWSDWNIETDANGNVTGFKEKDFEQKDKDGDGEISDAERAEWDQKKKEENDAAGGAPGEVDNPPDWDKNRDGKPDPGFELDCYQCVKSFTEPQCLDGAPGPCDSHACSQDEQCFEHTEKFGASELICHNCGPKEEIVPLCESCGHTSDPGCSGKCPSLACVPIDVDIDNCEIIPSMRTRVRGSTQKCYTCMNIREIVIEYYVLIIETPHYRFVLGKDKAEQYKSESVMALAKVDQSTGKIQNTMGELKSVTDFLGGFNVGFGPMGIPTTGKVSMDQLTGLLANNLKKNDSFKANCFDNVQNEADTQAEAQGTPTSSEIIESSKESGKGKDQKNIENNTEDQLKAADQAGSPAISGPIIACGKEGREKALKIYDASGALIDTITQSMLKLNPNILTEKLGAAQQFTDMFIQKSGFDFASYVEKFTGLPLKDIQSYAAQVSEIKSRVDQAAESGGKKKKKKGEEEKLPILPNDPLYKAVAKEHKKLFGVLGSSKKPPPVVIGSILKMGDGVLGSGSAVQEKDEDKIPDQYSLPVIGFTPWDDPNSAWNVVDANEKNIVVAVVDSGLDMTHEDGPQYLWTNPKETAGNGIDDDKNGFVDDLHGWNFLNENHDFTDVRGHGTFIAGIIAAKYNNGVGIAGINPGAVMMPIKVADDEGQTDSLNIYRGINYAVNHGAKVINVSLGSRNISKLEQQAVERAHAMGAIVVIAAGNINEHLMSFGPSSSKYGLAVGEINYNGERSTASNWGPNLGLVAPGEKIYSLCSKDNKDILPSLRKAGYYQQDGTSFSTPMVTATASLIWAKNPNLKNDQVADIILSTAKDMGEEGWDGMTGAGLLNAAAALRAESGQALTIMFTNLRVNRDQRGQVVSVDIFGTVRGHFKEFILEVGKGKKAARFETAAGPFHEPIEYQHIARLNVKDFLRGSEDWTLRLKVIDEIGQARFASTPFILPK